MTEAKVRSYTRAETERLNAARPGAAAFTPKEVTRVYNGDRTAVLEWFTQRRGAFMPEYVPTKLEQAFNADAQLVVGFACPRDGKDSFLVHDGKIAKVLDFPILDFASDGRSRILPA